MGYLWASEDMAPHQADVTVWMWLRSVFILISAMVKLYIFLISQIMFFFVFCLPMFLFCGYDEKKMYLLQFWYSFYELEQTPEQKIKVADRVLCQYKIQFSVQFFSSVHEICMLQKVPWCQSVNSFTCNIVMN